MRIALVVPGGVDPPGGERVIPFVHHLVESLVEQHQVTIIATGHDTEPGEWSMFGAPVVNVPVGDHGKVDIGRVLYEVPRAIGRHGRPQVVHGLWANLPGLAAVVAARRFRVPSVVSVCGGELAAVPAIGYGGGLRDGTRRLALLALRGATATTVATEWMRQHVQAAGGRVHEVIPLGADLRHCTVAAGTPPRPQHLVHLAGRNLVKDQDLLLRAFALALHDEPRLTLTIAGGDTLAGHHEQLATELGVADRVEFLGHVPHDQLAPVLAGAALHALTSHHDAGPLAVLEAAACGVPTVGTSVGHVADFAAMRTPAAVAVADRRPATLAYAITQLLADRPRRDALSRAAHSWATQHDAAFTASAFDQLYRRLAARSANA
ncbi:MAG: glycosyltransferase family 4 protein [Actinobacteria bacterium]|nr:glycosyltransferase family 4 protein [Actinomycetota bacterium]